MGRSNDERTLPFLGHLEELRERLIRAFVAFLLGTVAGWFLAPFAITGLTAPIQQAGLVSKDARIGRVVVAEDGTWRFTNWDEIVPVGPVAKDAPPPEPSQLEGLEFYRAGSPEPVAIWLPPQRAGFLYLKPMDPLTIRFKAALAIGLLLSLPVMLWEVYAFVLPGLLPREKVWVVPLYLAAIVLFPTGAAFAYWMIRFALMFFAQYATPEALLLNDMREYLSFALTTMIAFGVVFELPLVVLLLTRLGLVRVETLARQRKVVFVALLIISAVATPTGDPLTLMAMTIPLYVLFEVALAASAWVDRRTARAENAEAAGD